jgi:peroxiredoxin Q/BCP
VSEEAPPAVEPRPEPVGPGDEAPGFVLPAVDAQGNQFTVDLHEAIARGPVLLVFYQDDGMPICTTELKAIAQEYDLLADAGVQVFGVNTNGIGSHAKFQERDHFPFPLVSDFYAEAVKAYGLWDSDQRKSRRAVVIVGKDGRVRHTVAHFNPGNVNALVEVFEALGLV